MHTVAKSQRDCEKLSSDVESLKANFEANEFKLKASNAALDIERNKRQLPTTTTICSVFRRLRQLERRLDFANSRLPLLRTHLLLLHGKSSTLPLKCFTDQSTQINCGFNSWIGDILSESEKDE
ncbi:unnamed protein product [Trichobilharzia regenti]|nr:unnamed protein product [Trichobilharzia regenti]